MGPLLSSCWNFCFFWCLSMFGASSGLVFLVFLVPVNVLWSQSHQTCTGTKKNKKTTRCTKPAQAPKKPKKLKFPELWVHFWVVAGIFVFFCFFGACRCLVHLVVWFFWFFGACQCFVKSESPNLHRHQKNKKNKPLDAPNLHRHQKNQKNKISRNYGSTSE